MVAPSWQSARQGKSGGCTGYRLSDVFEECARSTSEPPVKVRYALFESSTTKIEQQRGSVGTSFAMLTMKPCCTTMTNKKMMTKGATKTVIHQILELVQKVLKEDKIGEARSPQNIQGSSSRRYPGVLRVWDLEEPMQAPGLSPVQSSKERRQTTKYGVSPRDKLER